MRDILIFMFYGVLVLGVAGMPVFAIYKSWTADGHADYCYIRQLTANDTRSCDSTEQFRLCGSVDWRQDDIIGYFKTQDDARAEAAKINCEIRP